MQVWIRRLATGSAVAAITLSITLTGALTLRAQGSGPPARPPANSRDLQATNPDARRPLASTGKRIVEQMTRSSPRETTLPAAASQHSAQAPWIQRHGTLAGALAGAATGCAIGAAGVGGSTDNFFNALDEFACPVVAAIGAAAGALLGWMLSH